MQTAILTITIITLVATIAVGVILGIAIRNLETVEQIDADTLRYDINKLIENTHLLKESLKISDDDERF